LQEEPVVADEPVAMAEHEGEADGVKENTAKASVDDALDKNVHGFAASTETGLQHGETNLHAEDQEGRNQRPHRIYGVDYVGGFDFRSAGLCENMTKEQACDHEHSHQGQAYPKHFAGQ